MLVFVACSKSATQIELQEELPIPLGESSIFLCAFIPYLHFNFIFSLRLIEVIAKGPFPHTLQFKVSTAEWR